MAKPVISTSEQKRIDEYNAKAKKEAEAQQKVNKDEKIVSVSQSNEWQKAGIAEVVAMFDNEKGIRVHKVRMLKKIKDEADS
jgi:hypothetical protein